MKTSLGLFFGLWLASLGSLNAGSITLAGADASEANGNGWALRIPDLDATSPGVYDPVEVAPINPFNIGTITWTDSSVPASGAATLAVTNAMCAFNFAPYAEAVVQQLAGIGGGGVTIVLSDITGPGLLFENRMLKSIQFTAHVSWTMVFNGFPVSQAYQGSVTFAGNRFVWNMSEGPVNWPIFGATDVHFEFDLTATLPGLYAPVTSDVMPSLVLAKTAAQTELLLKILFPEASAASYRLESSSTLTGAWAPMGSDFNSTSVPADQPLNIQDVKRSFYRVQKLTP